MLGFLLTLLILFSVSCAVYIGDTQAVSSSAATGAEAAIYLCLSLSGSMAFWGGMLKITDRCGVTQCVTSLLGRPVSRLLGKPRDDELTRLVSLGAAVNMLGIGNAAVPLALKAMKNLDKEESCRGRRTAFLIILNTASLQLLPITTAAMRTRHGAANPWDIIPAALMTSAAALAAGLTTAAVLFPKNERSDTA